MTPPEIEKPSGLTVSKLKKCVLELNKLEYHHKYNPKESHMPAYEKSYDVKNVRSCSEMWDEFKDGETVLQTPYGGQKRFLFKQGSMVYVTNNPPTGIGGRGAPVEVFSQHDLDEEWSVFTETVDYVPANKKVVPPAPPIPSRFSKSSFS